MKILKKVTAFLLAFVMAFSMSLISQASPAIGTTCYVDSKTPCKNSKTGTTYRAVYSMDYTTVKNDGQVCYCIEPGAVFTRTFYKASKPTDNTTWKNINATAREGIALTAMFGFPTRTAAAMGVSNNHEAYAATQAIIWEYVKGERTNPSQSAGTTGKAIIGTPAEPAYWNILSKIKEYQSDSRYVANAETSVDLVVLTSASASTEQGMVFFKGKAPEYPAIKTGKIEIKKTGSNGNKLLGATFKITNNVTFESKYVTTDINGYAFLDEIVFGTYTVTETVFPTGYYAGNYQTSWTVTLNDSTPNSTVTINAVNEIIPGNCKIVKTSEDGKVDGITFTLEGNGVNKTVTTNTNGEIQIDGLKPGTYTVTETEIAKYVPQAVKNVTVVSGQTSTVTFNNTLKRGNLTVTKTAEDGFVKGIKFHLSGTSLSGLAVDEYAVTDSIGKAYFNDVLIGSGYILEEVDVGEKYLVPENQLVDILWNEVAEKSVHNILKKCRLSIYKKGEVFWTVAENNGIYSPVYEVKGLQGAEYSVIAAEDIITPDGTKRYSRGEIVDTVITDIDGIASTSNLYLGKYEIKETKAPYGMVLNTEPKTVEFIYAEQNVEIAESNVSFNNDRQRAKITLSKILEEDEFFNIKGNIEKVKFGLFAGENMTAADGSVIPKDGLFEEIFCDNNGDVVFTADIPIGARLYVKEITTDEHYIILQEEYPITFNYAGQDVSEIIISANNGTEILNNLKKGCIKGLKFDRETDMPIADVLFGIFKGDETEFTDTTAILTVLTDKDGIFEFIDIPLGKYIVKELKQADGYLSNTEIYKVEVTENGEIIELNIQNDRIPEIYTTATVNGEKKVIAKGEITITDTVTYKHLIVGKEYVIKGILMDKSTGKPFLVDGKEVTAELKIIPEKPNGEVKLNFTFNTDFLNETTSLVVFERLYKDGFELTSHTDIEDEGQTVEITVPVPESPKTGDVSKPLTALLILITALATFISILIYLNCKRRKAQ